MSRRCTHNTRLNQGALWLAALEAEYSTVIEGNAQVGPESCMMSCLCCGSLVAATSAISHCCGGSGRNRRPVLLDLKRGALFCSACSSFLGGVRSLKPKKSEGKKKKGFGRRRSVTASEESILRQVSQPLRPKDGHPLGLRGLVNLGNTCFASCILQALLQSPPLVYHFLSDKHSPLNCPHNSLESEQDEADSASDSEGKFCIACAFDQLFREVYSGQRRPYNPSDFLIDWWNWAGSHAGSLATYQQQDAHEFYLSVLSALHSALTHPEKGKSTALEGEGNSIDSFRENGKGFHSPCFPGSPHSHDNASWQLFAFGGESSIITKCFSGVLRSDVTCEECRLTSTNFDPCLDIPVDLHPSISKTEKSNGVTKVESCTLQKSLEHFTSVEKLCHGEKYFCHWCNGPQTSVKQMSISKLPPILCMHVKRFEYAAAQQKFTKLDGYVAFPLQGLDMKPYMSSTVLGEQVLGAHNGPSLDDRDHLYDLYAVVSHKGKLTGGHYIVYIQSAGSWYCCDDAWVTRVDEKDVASCQAYLLFYIQQHLL